MTKLKQLNESFPNGDCQRTVFACLLDMDSPELVPNFTEMEDSHDEMVKMFDYNVQKWLDENNLYYLEMTIEAFKVNSSPFMPEGYCTIIGKSPRGEHSHIVIGKLEEIDNKYEISFVWDTSPLHNGIFLDTVEYIGFLSRRL